MQNIAGFGAVLRGLRRELGLSQSELALKLGSTQRHFSFLETGRSQPSRDMIARLATGLDLSAGQRAALFEASGFRSPYSRRHITSPDIVEALDMIADRVLAHWPFPAFALDPDWTVLRANTPAEKMLAMFASESSGGPRNLLQTMLSPAFNAMIENWGEASTAFYFRLLTAAGESTLVREALAQARADGLFDGISQTLANSRDIPVYVPLVMAPMPGVKLRLTSVLGQLASVHDALVEGIDIEFLVPIDASSELTMLAMLG